jgi:hypothetical protein
MKRNLLEFSDDLGEDFDLDEFIESLVDIIWGYYGINLRC